MVQLKSKGLLIETKPGILARFLHNRRVAHKCNGKVLSFNTRAILPEFDEAAYIPLSHTAMYSQTGNYTELIKNFICTGKFSIDNTQQSIPNDTVYYGVKREIFCGR